MPASSLDLMLNVRASGASQVREITREITRLIESARKSDIISAYDPYATRADAMSKSIAMKEKQLDMTHVERMALHELSVLEKERTEELKRQYELDSVTWEIMKAKTIDYRHAVALAKEELMIRELVAESMAASAAGVTGRTLNVGATMTADPMFSSAFLEGQKQVEQGNYVLEESFNIVAASLDRINMAGNQTNGVFADMISKQEAVILRNTQMANMTDEQRIMLGAMQQKVQDTTNAVHISTQKHELWMEVNRRGNEIFKQGNVTQAEAIALAEKEIMTKAEQTAADERLAEQKKKLNTELKTERMQLMQTSIGMFVLGITTTQTLGAISQMVGQQTALGKAMKEMSNSVKLMLGPFQMFLALQQLQLATNKKMLASALPMMTALGSIYFLYKAITEQSKPLRIAYGAIAGALAALTAAKWLHVGANTALAASNVAVEASNPFTAWKVPITLALIGASVGAVLAMMGSLGKGQTIPGYMRPIRETGAFYGHKGEMVGRVGAMVPSNTNNNSVNITINLSPGSTIDRGMIPQLSREIEMAVASGNGA